MDRPYAFIVVTNNQGQIPNVVRECADPIDCRHKLDSVYRQLKTDMRIVHPEVRFIETSDHWRHSITTVIDDVPSELVTTVQVARNLIPNNTERG